MRRILLTGAGGSLGGHVAQKLTEDGFRVIEVRRPDSSSRNARVANEVIHADLLTAGGVGHVLEGLGRDDSSVYGFVHLARDKGNLVGRGAGSKEWLAEYELSVFVPFQLSMLMAARFALKRVILASSVYGVVAQKPHIYSEPTLTNPQYGAAKAATIQVVRDLAVALAPDCQVNSIAWGGIDTGVSEEIKSAYSKESPTARMLTVDEAYGAIRFLLSSSASGVSGHNLVVDGGWSAW